MSANRVALAHMLELLTNDCPCKKDIVDATGLSYSTVIDYMKIFKRMKLIRIVEWRQHTRCYVPHYEWNSEGLRDVSRPKPQTRAEIARNYRERKAQKQLNSLKVTHDPIYSTRND